MVPKIPKNSGSTPTPCLDKAVLAQGGGGVPWPGKRQAHRQRPVCLGPRCWPSSLAIRASVPGLRSHLLCTRPTLREPPHHLPTAPNQAGPGLPRVPATFSSSLGGGRGTPLPLYLSLGHSPENSAASAPKSTLYHKRAKGNSQLSFRHLGPLTLRAPPPPPLCDIPSGCSFFTGPWTVTRSSLRMLRRVAAFCQPLRPVLLLVSFPR